jgi:hypothetical protein
MGTPGDNLAHVSRVSHGLRTARPRAGAREELGRGSQALGTGTMAISPKLAERGVPRPLPSLSLGETWKSKVRP